MEASTVLFERARDRVGMTEEEGTVGRWCDKAGPVCEDNAEIMSVESLEPGMTPARDLQDVLHFDPRRGGGTTYQASKAGAEGLSYQPPHDPPVIPSIHPRGVEMAAGFAPRMEATLPEARVLPPRVREGDLQIEQDVRNALRYAAEIAQLGDIEVHVENGTAYLRGTVQSVDDIGRVDEIVGALRNVNQVYSELEVQY
jgi:hypothetical protein